MPGALPDAQPTVSKYRNLSHQLLF